MRRARKSMPSSPASGHWLNSHGCCKGELIHLEKLVKLFHTAHLALQIAEKSKTCSSVENNGVSLIIGHPDYEGKTEHTSRLAETGP